MIGTFGPYEAAVGVVSVAARPGDREIAVPVGGPGGAQLRGAGATVREKSGGTPEEPHPIQSQLERS
jgi:hypothetical protein